MKSFTNHENSIVETRKLSHRGAENVTLINNVVDKLLNRKYNTVYSKKGHDLVKSKT